ncbi:hypothetical protein JTE90_027260 [Oedothorax gibbosus]|uniref:Eukaryotic translation initiation factor 2 subunit 2 n=1 Tax=Oedothorax gibbosus TaxID=931172 RepID=A0AAV6VZ82_9ARAC|nr:hypothetical protein JTE90_027260 [Oedothorax gibbosus]
MENSVATELPELLDFTGLKKKKTVKVLKKSFQQVSSKEDLNQNSLFEITNNVPDTITKAKSSGDPQPLEEDLSFDNMKKKRKKKVLNIDEVVSTTSMEDSTTIASSLAPLDSEGDDYTYDDLLARIYSLMREKDPKRDLENRKKLVMKPPQVIRIGSKKTSFVNFLEICKLMHRAPNHLQSFLLAELGTTASVDGNNQLIIKGRFEQKQIETVLRRYIKEYVTCHTCKSPDTVLSKETRLFFLQCESCGSRCSVASIKSGFQAVTGKRAVMRAKTT